MGINIFNRRELTVMFSLSSFNECCDKLNDANVDYICKLIDRQSPSATNMGSRARTGSYGVNQEVNYEYKIYVHKDDLARATAVINAK